MPSVARAPPTMAAGAASTPRINWGEVESIAKSRMGKTEPYSPYTAGRPETSAYPMAMGIETAAIIIPVKISLSRYSFL